MPKVGMQPIRRRQLIDATLEAINEVGMHDATIAQIARRAGVSTGIISHYFKDKNGLLEATMRDITGQLRDAVLSRLRALPDGSAEQRLQAIVGGNFDETQTSSAAMKAWLAFWASSMHQPMLYRLQPHTGRKHQLRVHMAALGAPIVNDAFYPEALPCKGDDFANPLKLLARSIRFDDPLTGEARRFDSARVL